MTPKENIPTASAMEMRSQVVRGTVGRIDVGVETLKAEVD